MSTFTQIWIPLKHGFDCGVHFKLLLSKTDEPLCLLPSTGNSLLHNARMAWQKKLEHLFLNQHLYSRLQTSTLKQCNPSLFQVEAMQQPGTSNSKHLLLLSIHFEKCQKSHEVQSHMDWQVRETKISSFQKSPKGTSHNARIALMSFLITANLIKNIIKGYFYEELGKLYMCRLILSPHCKASSKQLS